MTINSGNYGITNVRFAKLTRLTNGNQGTPIASAGDNNPGLNEELWVVRKQSNGKYTVSNKAQKKFPHSSRPNASQDVTVKASGTQWETNKGDYTINPSNDTDLYWSLSDNQTVTGVTPANATTGDRKANWTVRVDLMRRRVDGVFRCQAGPPRSRVRSCYIKLDE